MYRHCYSPFLLQLVMLIFYEDSMMIDIMSLSASLFPIPYSLFPTFAFIHIKLQLIHYLQSIHFAMNCIHTFIT